METELINKIHAVGRPCVLALTGGGSSAVAQLMKVTGASRTILEAIIPYSSQSLSDFLGHTPAQSCCRQTALAMAERALDRAAWLAPGQEVLGLGCTASLATDRPKKGPHRFFLAITGFKRTVIRSMELAKGARTREAEELLLGSIVLCCFAHELGLNNQVSLPLGSEEELLEVEIFRSF